MSNFDENKHPRASDGKFTDGNGGYSAGVNKRIKWANENGKEVPLNADGSLDDLKLQELYEENRTKKKKISDYVENFRKGNGVEGEITLSDVGEKERKAIEKLTGEKLTATKHVLSLDELRHIEKRHGTNGDSDHSMSDMSRYEQIIDVLQNPDRVDFCVDKKGRRVFSNLYRDKNNNPAKMITFIKNYDEYMQMVVEAVCDSRRGKLHVITSYTKKREP